MTLCPSYPVPASEVYDVLTLVPADTHITAQYDTGLITVDWNGLDMDFFGYVWKITLSDNSEHLMEFTINYMSTSSLNCTAAIWSASPNSYTLTEQYGDYTSFPIPTYWTDVE